MASQPAAFFLGTLRGAVPSRQLTSTVGPRVPHPARGLPRLGACLGCLGWGSSLSRAAPAHESKPCKSEPVPGLVVLGVLPSSTRPSFRRSPFLGLSLTFWRLAVFVHFFFDETGAFLDFSFDAHFCHPLCWLISQR